jgi:hypothetical protein
VLLGVSQRKISNKLYEDLIPSAAFVAKALTGSGFRAYLFILERVAAKSARNLRAAAGCALDPQPQQPQEAKQIRDLQAGAE